MKRIRLLVVDDHELVRMGLRTLFERFDHIEVAGEAGTARQGLDEAKRLQPDVVLLDIRLPDGNGFEVCRQIQTLSPGTRVLILTSYADDKIVFESIDAGADGYLLKEINGEALIEAIEQIARGQSVLDPFVTGRVLARVKNPQEPLAGLDLLSSQEKRVLALVAEGKTNKEIGGEMGLSDKTVKNYLSHVLEKLKLSRRSQAAAYYVQHMPR